ncbi:unnamed protein product [Durusdinium trenchii]|uniref:Uncharacterized protein n=1 Tax=Durusdinium trenchii TaxID=1381693 RepID=A0ABP0LM66_9DINO
MLSGMSRHTVSSTVESRSSGAPSRQFTPMASQRQRQSELRRSIPKGKKKKHLQQLGMHFLMKQRQHLVFGKNSSCMASLKETSVELCATGRYSKHFKTAMLSRENT